jgi:hypothetical protein
MYPTCTLFGNAPRVEYAASWKHAEKRGVVFGSRRLGLHLGAHQSDCTTQFNPPALKAHTF